MARRTLIAFLPAVLFVGLGVVLAAGTVKPAVHLAEGYLDRPLPQFEQPPLAGMPRGLANADLAGKAALVNVFASWCGACKIEHPVLMRLKDDSPLPIFGLNWKDRPGAGAAFLQRFGNPYRGTGDDATGSLGAALGVTGVPETYLVDAQGRIRYRHIGPIDDAVWTGVLKPLIDQMEQRG